jgi:hypothetical protein
MWFVDVRGLYDIRAAYRRQQHGATAAVALGARQSGPCCLLDFRFVSYRVTVFYSCRSIYVLELPLRWVCFRHLHADSQMVLLNIINDHLSLSSIRRHRSSCTPARINSPSCRSGSARCANSLVVSRGVRRHFCDLIIVSIATVFFFFFFFFLRSQHRAVASASAEQSPDVAVTGAVSLHQSAGASSVLFSEFHGCAVRF